MSLHRTTLPLALALTCLASQAQTTQPTPADCPPEQRDDCKPGDEPDRGTRNNDAASPQVSADAPLPAAGGGGGPATTLRYDRGPLKVRNYGLSVGVDHALSRQWVLGGLVNVAKGRVERSQTETATNINGTNTFQSDTTVNTHSTSLAASLSYFTTNAIAFDGVLSYMRTQLETRRVSAGQGEFSGDNLSHSWGTWLSASRIWRFGPRAFIPQLGLEYVDTRTDAVAFVDAANPAAAPPPFSVSDHRQRTLATLLSAQLQQPYSMGFGTLTPYVRATWRERLWKKASPITATNSNNLVRDLDPDAAESRSSIGLAGGVIAQFTRGVSSFVDVSYRRGTNQLRETRLGLGLKFEI